MTPAMPATPAPIVIYTDGACKGNPGPGGWAAILSHNGRQRQLSGGEAHTTNNRMEMTAVLQALGALKKENCRVQLFTDSEYVMRGMQEWLPGWRRKNFRRSNGKPVLNEDLWRALDDACTRHRIEWNWVRGHSGNEGNEQADTLAQQEAERHREVAQ